jgi:hypothetical protein
LTRRYLRSDSPVEVVSSFPFRKRMASIGPCFEYAIKKTVGIVECSFAG